MGIGLLGFVTSAGSDALQRPIGVAGVLGMASVAALLVPGLGQVLVQRFGLGAAKQASFQRLATDHAHALRKIETLSSALEQARLQNAVVEETNTELQNFVALAAHDLRAPLRGIENLLNWTLEDHGRQLPQQARENVTLALQRANRLSAHLNGLLAYSRTGAVDGCRATLDLQDVCFEIKADHLARPGFVVRTKGDLLRFDVPHVAVKTVLLNLITNAVKHHDKHTGRVIVSAAFAGPVLEILVQDDGPGIALAHQARIFQLFETLQSKEDTENSGLGLPLARKLARAIGADITVHSDPDRQRGSTFVLRLPRHAWDVPTQRTTRVRAA